MTKQEFLSKLEELLKSMPEGERKDILYDYEEHFQNGMANGKSEEEIAGSLGSPQTIAKEILAGYHVAQAAANVSVVNITRAVLATVSLGFINLVFVLGPFLGIIGILTAFYGVALALIATPVLMLLAAGFPSEAAGILAWIFTSMITVGAGILLGIGMIFVTKWAGKAFLKYLQFNIRIIKGA
ncbi:MAG TPA: DUF1700 domain-containing protein [Methylomusa anaerophila]|uniref:DUF1700 domain-containing protein n=1 Tax=Methylomusa anaerophila TaxID=1930071 RepID=A0A348ALQ7_9FIRM|nr:DUF1700 domain-containing protein [Methylomusa anaerophila]BBB92005.1 hypothetical protein MAMMFC1_02690 [Methylomusa anaerophila]HML87983.1 DUF1700 domain-containing protein [Methylomusa anaerophila]